MATAKLGSTRRVRAEEFLVEGNLRHQFNLLCIQHLPHRDAMGRYGTKFYSYLNETNFQVLWT